MASSIACHSSDSLMESNRYRSFVHSLSLHCVDGILSGVLARTINANLSKLGVDTFDWNGFVDCIRILAKEIRLPLNDLIRKLLIADEFAFQKWHAETEYIPDEGSSKKINRLWDGKKVR